jgi:hypothetical protein
MKIFNDISNYNNTSDYLPILNGALITDLVVISRVIMGFITDKSMKTWYRKYGLSAIIADVLIIVLGILLTRFIYPFVFKDFSIILFAALAVCIQVIHDLLFAQFVYAIPRGKSEIIDTFKDYAKEVGPTILLADAAMMVSSIVISSVLSTMNLNTNMIVLIISIYIIPYFLYSI